MYHFDALWPSFVHWKSVIQLFRFLRATLNRHVVEEVGCRTHLEKNQSGRTTPFLFPPTLLPSLHPPLIKCDCFMLAFYPLLSLSFFVNPFLLRFYESRFFEFFGNRKCEFLKGKISRTFRSIQSRKKVDGTIREGDIDSGSLVRRFRSANSIHFTAYSLLVSVSSCSLLVEAR